MPSTVPEPLATIAKRLQCPVCRHPLAAAPGSLICPAGHRHDVARQGYVTLQSPSRRPFTGDDARMVAARVAVQEAGYFQPLTTALAHEAGQIGGPGVSLILDVGAGTGHHLAGVVARTAHARGVALDASRAASQLAARAHPWIAAVRADVWQRIPLRDGSVDLALSVFAPRNGTELARVLRPGGTLIVVTPAPEHLRLGQGRVRSGNTNRRTRGAEPSPSGGVKRSIGATGPAVVRPG